MMSRQKKIDLKKLLRSPVQLIQRGPESFARAFSLLRLTPRVLLKDPNQNGLPI